MSEDKADYLIVGGGTAGCVLAARLSEDPRLRVVLVEAGPDREAENRPDLTEVYGGRAFMDHRYYWPDLMARHSSTSAAPVPYRQGMLLGGGSAINGQIALRGLPADYDGWRDMGAAGWGWDDVAPVFRALETDLDFDGAAHGSDGPVKIKRAPEPEWDVATRAFMRAWTELGSPFISDLNSAFGDGHGPLPFSNDGHRRHSTVHAYLTPAVRARANLRILTGTRVIRVVTESGQATGVSVAREGGSATLAAERVILSAGALRSPQLLMLSGIGDGAALATFGIVTVAHRRGVGRNLQDHPITSLSAYTRPDARLASPNRAVLAYRRYSSGFEGCEPSDMVMSAGARTMWHAVGERVCALRTYIALPYSRGAVTLAAADPAAAPLVDFAGLSDQRDLDRMVAGFRAAAAITYQHLYPEIVSDVFPATLSRRIETMSRPNALNATIARVGAAVMDASPRLRSLLIRRVITDGVSLPHVLPDDDATADYVRSILGTSWHPCGTCRMGRADDDEAVATPDGSIIGVPGLHVIDASIMPQIPRTNTNLPTIMIAEKLAAELRSAT